MGTSEADKKKDLITSERISPNLFASFSIRLTFLLNCKNFVQYDGYVYPIYPSSTPLFQLMAGFCASLLRQGD